MREWEGEREEMGEVIEKDSGETSAEEERESDGTEGAREDVAERERRERGGGMEAKPMLKEG